MRTILQPFYTAWALLTFVLSVLVAFPFFFFISLANNSRARRTIWWIIHTWAKGWLWIIGMPLRKRGSMSPNRRYVIVANHISYLDPILLFPAVPSYFRPLGKKEFSHIPIIGFIYKQTALLVDRSSAHSRARSMRLMWRALHKECSIIIFPEGTFNETDKPLKDFYDGAFRLAINAQTPVLPILFPDTVRRWHYSHWWKIWPGRNRVSYLQPVATEGMTMADLGALKKKVYQMMEEELIRLG